jgi:hypothetical protein
MIPDRTCNYQNFWDSVIPAGNQYLGDDLMLRLANHKVCEASWPV